MEKVHYFFQFPQHSQWFIAVGALLALLSAVSFALGRNKLAVGLLVVGAFCIRLFAATLDPYLHDWDERFHALVAKNMTGHFFLPTLYEDPTFLNPAETEWIQTHVWLHKQPLFLWQIALSFKLFGVHEFALRLPSALMGSLLVLLLVRIGKLVDSERTGFIAGFLSVSSFFLVELISGNRGMDHNDITFLFYATASIWAWLEYMRSGKRRWIYLVGLFVGCAVLVKWLVGLLVYAGWGIAHLTDAQKRLQWRSYLPMVQALAVSVLVAVPWQIYTFTSFPEVARQEFAYNSAHLFESLEGHGGDWLFHWNNLSELYGPLWLLLFPGIVILAWRIKPTPLRWGVISMPLVVYAFFTLAATKLHAYPLVTASVLWVAMASLIHQLFIWLEKRVSNRWLTDSLLVLVLAVVGAVSLRPQQIFQNHNPEALHSHMRQMLVNKPMYLRLKQELPADAVVFNVNHMQYIEAMYYLEKPVHPGLPTEAQIKLLESEKRNAYVFPDASVSTSIFAHPRIFQLNDTIAY